MLDLWFEKKIKTKVRGICHLVRYADDFLCMVQYANDARHIEQLMRDRFVTFDLELRPDKTRIIHLDREQRCRNNRKDHPSHTFDFWALLIIGVRAAKVIRHYVVRPVGRSFAERVGR